MKYETTMPTQLILIRLWKKTQDSTGMLLQFLSGIPIINTKERIFSKHPSERKTQTDERYEQNLKDSEMAGYSALSSAGY